MTQHQFTTVANCRICGKVFPTYPSRLKRGAGLYCSAECRCLSMRRHPREATCEVCNTVFSIKPQTHPRTCSPECTAVLHHSEWTARFWSKVNKNGPLIRPELGECWNWTAALTNGYGVYGVGRGTRQAHVIAWELASGAPVPKGRMVLHICDYPACLRNDEPGIYVVEGRELPRFGHLFLGTNADNMADMRAKGRSARGDRNRSRLYPETLQRGEQHWTKRTGIKPFQNAIHPFGEKHPMSKLTEEQAREILHAEGVTALDLAERCGVGMPVIWRVRSRKTWKHLT